MRMDQPDRVSSYVIGALGLSLATLAFGCQSTPDQGGSKGSSNVDTKDDKRLDQKALLSVPQVDHKPVCAASSPGSARCHAHIQTNSDGTVRAFTTPSGLTPANLQSAYLAASTGSSLTVAIVDAYDNPNAESDLAVYRTQFGLPACTTANGCFKKVNQTGATSPLPTPDSGWAAEISLDVQMVSAICPTCKILLVEADSNSYVNLGTAENTAATLASVISNSYGGSESSSTTSYDATYFNHPGILITVSSGDSGYGVQFPASSSHVLGIGGTSLVSSGSSRGWAETVWSGAGSGCSAYVAKPSFQTDTGCSKRMVADISAVADPATGVAMYETYHYTGWIVMGGTSAAAPIVAASFAAAGRSDVGNSYPYSNASAFNDVTSGSNGTCSTPYFCTGEVGYDGPTGIGTPKGTTIAIPPSPPSPPTGVSASDGIFTDKVQVSWTAANTAASYQVYRNTSNSSTGATQIGTPTGTSYDDTTATAGTTYYYFVKACNTVGCSDFSSSDSGFRSTGGPTPPTVTASDGDYTDKVRVSWTSSTGATYYRVYRNTSSSSSAATQIQGAATASPYDDTSATPTTTYYYFVKACTSAGCGEFSTPDQGYRAVPPSNAIYDATLLAPKCGSPTPFCDSGTLLVGRGTMSPAELHAPNTIANSCADGNTGTFHDDESLDRLQITSLDGTNLAPGKSARIDATVWAYSTSSDYLDLYLTTDATAGTLVWNLLTPTTLKPTATGSVVLSQTITLPATGATQWAIRGNFRFNSSTQSSCSTGSYDDRDDLIFVVDTSPTSPPSPPTGVSASDGIYTDKVHVAWTASGGATSYKVYRNTSNASSGATQIGTPTASPYDDTTTTPGATYYYFVKACNTAGCSDFSTSDSGYQGLSFPTGVTASDGSYTDKVQVSWTASTGATSYQVYRNTSNASSGATQIGTPTATSYNDTTATPGTTYYYFVEACSTAGCSNFSSSDSG